MTVWRAIGNYNRWNRGTFTRTPSQIQYKCRYTVNCSGALIWLNVSECCSLVEQDMVVSMFVSLHLSVFTTSNSNFSKRLIGWNSFHTSCQLVCVLSQPHATISICGCGISTQEAKILVTFCLKCQLRDNSFLVKDLLLPSSCPFGCKALHWISALSFMGICIINTRLLLPLF